SITRYGFRSFDRQFCFADERICDRHRPPLWKSLSDQQIFLTSLLTNVLGEGPSAFVTPYPPDLHHFRGSFGGKDIIPLWRDAKCRYPNITNGLIELLTASYAKTVKPEELFAYVYAVLNSPLYADKFSEELSEPGPRIPITKD